MAITYARKNQKQHNVLYSAIAGILICAIFLTMVVSLYSKAETEAHDMLHIQTKQIKDDLILQIKSDRENLSTMANFAAKLYADGKGYDRMFDSFKPIGLFSRIGILNPDGTFITKDGTVDLSDKISFEEQALLGEHITGRTMSYSVPDEEVLRSSVPIQVNGETVGIIYGIIKIETINEKYNTMAKELDAQLFVYDKTTGKFIVDTINTDPGELSQLKTREYGEGHSYEELVTTDKGFTSFKSIRSEEELFVHYSTIEDFDWGILLARYSSQVFADAYQTTKELFATFLAIVFVIVLYLQVVLTNEKQRTKLNAESSAIRKLLLEITEQYANVMEAMKKIKEYSNARSSFFFDTDGEDFCYIKPELQDKLLCGEDRIYFQKELFRYAASIHTTDKTTISMMRIIPNHHLAKTNPQLYDFLRKQEIRDISFAILADKNNHIGILGTINAKKGKEARSIIEDVAICFSIAIYNKKHLDKTEYAATTDSLTGALNRVAYKTDILKLDAERPEEFACIYIDVNELHLRNNKYGHAAGDEMLVYIANTLKEVFFGHGIYRMGGDEFLVFTKGVAPERIKKKLELFKEQLKLKEYNVALGMAYRTQNTNCEEMVREAEVKMYEAKAKYYQNKERERASEEEEEGYSYIHTGIREIDTMIFVLKEHYNGIYRVSLDNDDAHRILMPSYLGYNETEANFSNLLKTYINDIVQPDYQRAVMSFLNYDAIKRHIAEGQIPSITYQKTQGDMVKLSVYNLGENKDSVNETLWVFSKE